MGRKQISKLITGKWVVVICAFVLLLSACLPASTPVTPLPTNTPIPTETITPTVIWFPPTPTWTLQPTIAVTPTPETRPGIGPLLLEDDFTAAEPWLVGTMPNGTIALGGNEISLAIVQSKGYLYSFRNQPTLDNFYAEITASPNLCTGIDEYGMLIRYNSPSDFYRFSLSCDGQMRLDKVVGGTALSIQPWMYSTSVPTGAPSSTRLGVWVVGREMRFFVEDAYQFTITDRTLSRGMLGVFARASGETAVSVSFSDLSVYQIEQ